MSVLRPSLTSPWSSLLAGVCALSLLHCAREEQDVQLGNANGGIDNSPLPSSGGTGTGSGGPGDNGGSGSGDTSGLGNAERNDEITGGTSGQAYSPSELNNQEPSTDPNAPNNGNDLVMDPNFDPGDGQTGYYAGWANEQNDPDGYLTNPDGTPNGGPELYRRMAHCPEIKLGKFRNDFAKNGSAAYTAPIDPWYTNLSKRLSVTVSRGSIIRSFLQPWRNHMPIPLGFRPPSRWLFDSEWLPRTYPYEGCERCVFIPTRDTNKILMSVGGMLYLAPKPHPNRGKVFGRMDLVVFLEHERANEDSPYLPVQNGMCLRLRHAKIISFGKPFFQ